MTTFVAVSPSELVVRNNGRLVRIPVANLVSVDEAVAACAHAAIKNIGMEIEVPSTQPRGCRPRNYAYAGLLQ